jgi:hypothetical protein
MQALAGAVRSCGPVFSCCCGAWHRGLIIELMAATRAYAAPRRQQLGVRRVVVRREVVLDLPIAPLRLAPEIFLEPHLLDVAANAREPVDGAEHVGQLADRDVAAAERVEHQLQRRLGVVGRLDPLQLEGEPTVGAGRAHPLHAQPHRGRIAFLGHPQDLLGRGLRLFGQHLLDRDGLLVARAGRPPGRVAALSWLESHDGYSLLNPLAVGLVT